MKVKTLTFSETILSAGITTQQARNYSIELDCIESIILSTDSDFSINVTIFHHIFSLYTKDLSDKELVSKLLVSLLNKINTDTETENRLKHMKNKEPTDFDILKITTAYEQGVGKGQVSIACKNPYAGDFGDNACIKSWDMGFSEGQSILNRRNQTSVDGYRSEFLRVAAQGYDAAKSNMTQSAQIENPYDFSNENINYNAFDAGYYFYLSSVH